MTVIYDAVSQVFSYKNSEMTRFSIVKCLCFLFFVYFANQLFSHQCLIPISLLGSSNKERRYKVWHGKDGITILLQFSPQSQKAEVDYLVIGISLG